MHLFLKTRLVRATAASVAGLMLAGSMFPVAQAAAAPVIDRNQPAPTPNAQPDPFYTPPAVLPAGEPGDVIRARIAKAGPPTARDLAQAWQVMYLSRDSLDKPNVVTGTILVPYGVDPAKAPVVGMAPGTTGPAFRCTVSRFINSGSFYEQAGLNGLLKAGYAVAVTDYEGYHENPKTTYIAGRSMGHALIDGVRAATRLPDTKLSKTPKVAFQGFSQGGGASVWAGELLPTYAPELDVVGVSAGGVPGNLAIVASSLEQSPAFGFMIAALIGLDNAYPDLALESFLNGAGREAIPAAEADDCTVELLTGYSNKSFEDYTTTSPFGTSPWLNRAYENLAGTKPINVPVYQYHATNDDIVPYQQASALRDEYCSLGTKLQWKTYNTGHITTVARGNEGVLGFLADRFSGKPVVNDC